MAATKIDPKAAKEAQQKKLLIAMSVVLVALLAWQLPKYLGGGSSTPAAAPAAAPTDGGVTPAPVPGTTPGAVAPTPPPDLKTAAAGAKPKPGQAQLASFSLFKAKDPFVQKLDEKAATAKPGVDSPAKPDDGAGPAVPGGVTGPAVKPPAVIYGFATLSINGEDEPVTTKAEFPAEEPMFQVVAIGKGMVKVGIAGGKLTNGKLAVIRLGKSLTFVNDATGARYVVQLLYTGVEPEPTATFTTPDANQPATTTAP